MQRRRFVVILLGLGLAACDQSPTDLSLVRSAANVSGTGWELWSSRTTLPFPDVEFLPLFTETEEPGFYDLGQTVQHDGMTWEAMQFTHDKSFNVTVTAGQYLFGLVGDEWPAGTVNVVDEIHAGRLVAVVVDGVRVDITPAWILDLSSEEGSAAIYNVFPRFTTPGSHTLKYVWQQKRDFYFDIPFELFDITDPLGLDGRRVFKAGETVGQPADGNLTLSYNVTVVSP